jgi:hypothetical protein
VETVWYLLRNRRYEGPFELADLHVRAQRGQLSPDDYVIEEKNFDKGQMIYRRAAEILPRDAFSLVLSVPEVSEAEVASAAAENQRESAEPESYRPAQISNRGYEESVSPLRDGLSRLSFANMMGFCVVVIAAAWLFQTQNPSDEKRRPAEVAEASEGASGKRQVTREVVTRDAEAERNLNAPIEKLRPTERPSGADLVNRGAPATPRASRAPADRLHDAQNDRGLASEPQDSPERLDTNALEPAAPMYQGGDAPPEIIESDDPPPPFENDNPPSEGDGEHGESFEAQGNVPNEGGEAY